MSKKGKKNRISSEAKTCFAATAILLGVGLVLFITGKLFYHPAGMVNLEDIRTGQTATIVSVTKVDRNLTQSERKKEKEKGLTEDELDYEFAVEYSVNDNGTEYTYDERVPFRSGSSDPRVGDTEVINYAVVDGEFIVHPQTQSNNTLTFCGGFLMVLGVIAFLIGMFLRR